MNARWETAVSRARSAQEKLVKLKEDDRRKLPL
jgi:hypothetical protein